MTFAEAILRYVPKPLRVSLQRFVSVDRLKMAHFERVRAGLGSGITTYTPNIGLPRVGVLTNRASYHRYHLQACIELHVPCVTIDILAADWWEIAQRERCDAYLCWPDATLNSMAKVVKDRIDLLEQATGRPVVPGSKERWLYEDKQRLAEWLSVHEIAHPTTRVFVSAEAAASYAGSVDLPIVVKTSFGAAASGVTIVRKRAQLRSLVKAAFGRGIVARGHDHRDRQRGMIIFQEYVDIINEWRVLRTGRRYMVRLKERVGDFHSGSGSVTWAQPREGLLDFCHHWTEQYGLEFAAIDVFETRDGRLLVNEVQAVVGPITTENTERGSEHRGWWLPKRDGEDWRFVPGQAYRNAASNERVVALLEATGFAFSLRDGCFVLASADQPLRSTSYEHERKRPESG